MLISLTLSHLAFVPCTWPHDPHWPISLREGTNQPMGNLNPLIKVYHHDPCCTAGGYMISTVAFQHCGPGIKSDPEALVNNMYMLPALVIVSLRNLAFLMQFRYK